MTTVSVSVCQEVEYLVSQYSHLVLDSLSHRQPIKWLQLQLGLDLDTTKNIMHILVDPLWVQYNQKYVLKIKTFWRMLQPNLIHTIPARCNTALFTTLPSVHQTKSTMYREARDCCTWLLTDQPAAAAIHLPCHRSTVPRCTHSPARHLKGHSDSHYFMDASES